MKKLKLLFIIFILYFSFFFGCKTLSNLEKKETYEDLKRKYPLYPLLFINKFEFEGFLVIEKSKINDIKPGSYNVNLSYIKNSYIKIIANIKFASKDIEILNLDYDFVNDKGYISFMQSDKRIFNEEYLKSIDDRFSKDNLLYLINSIFLFFDKEQIDIIKNEGEHYFRDFIYIVENKIINKAILNIFIFYFYFYYKNYIYFNDIYYPSIIAFDFNNEIIGKLIFNKIFYLINH
jgi:hypothetical protein